MYYTSCKRSDLQQFHYLMSGGAKTMNTIYQTVILQAYIGIDTGQQERYEGTMYTLYCAFFSSKKR